MKKSGESSKQQSGKTHGNKTAGLGRNAALAKPSVSQLPSSIGNHAFTQLVEGRSSQPAQDPHAALITRAAQDPGSPLEHPLRQNLERQLGADLSNVRVHQGSGSAAAAESLSARAYTIGSDIYFGAEAGRLDEAARGRLLAHEAIHSVQQGGRPVPLTGALQVSRPSDAAEVEARTAAESFSNAGSGALALRDSLRATSVQPSIQRDIIGEKTWPGVGKFEINFKKIEGKVAGDRGVEDGKITFTPAATAAESDSIRFVQIARDFNVDTGDQFEWTGGEAPRMKMMTTKDVAKNIAGGFFLDQIHASQAQRTKKTDPTVLPYYDVTSPGTIGRRKGKTITAATLEDAPGSSGQRKFNFVTSAKAADKGFYYGTVLWGFDTFHDAKGVTKIRNEYKSFRLWQGETTDEAVRLFNEFYKNPGTKDAPTK